MKDEPLFALYRIYEYLLVDRTIWYRNAFEAFWRERDWAIAKIADPHDTDPTRYAFLAGVVDLLALSFNARIKLGIARGGPGILTEEAVDKLRNQREEDKMYEELPSWVIHVGPLSEPLDLRLQPRDDDEKSATSNDMEHQLDPCLLKRNILVNSFHVHFT